MGAAGRDREGRGVQEDLGRAAAAVASVRMRQMERGLGESEVEADQAAQASDGRRDRREQTCPRLGAGGFVQRRVVEEMQLVVGARGVDRAVRRYVDCAVVELCRGCCVGDAVLVGARDGW